MTTVTDVTAADELMPSVSDVQQDQNDPSDQQDDTILLEQVPESAKKFVVQLHQALSTANVPMITNLYERTFLQVTNEHFKTEEWPRAETVASLVHQDEVFLTFYRELYFRHLYSRFSHNIDIEDRYDSYENYCNLFNYLLNSEGPVPLELPIQWIWDIIDEFIWQFGSYSIWRAKVHEKTDEEIEMLQDSPQVWSAYSVLNVLYSLVQKSRIGDHLRALKSGDDADLSNSDEFGNKTLYRMLGFFSILGLLRVHVLLGDYTLALRVLDDVDIRAMASPNARLHSVHAAHVSAFFFIGFASLMLRRYGDAIDWLSKGISHFYKHRRFTPNAEQIAKQVDRMLGVVAVAHALLPLHRLDDMIKQGLAEKYAEQHLRMQRGPWDQAAPVFEELWLRACPKFVSPNPAPIEAPSSHADPSGARKSSREPRDAIHHQLKIFLADAKIRTEVVPDMRSLLKLYTTLSTDKLAGLMSGAAKGNQLCALCDLSIAKGSMSDLVWHQGSMLIGEREVVGDLGFGIDNDLIVIAETRRPRHLAEYFMRRSLKAADALQGLRAKSFHVQAAR